MVEEKRGKRKPTVADAMCWLLRVSKPALRNTAPKSQPDLFDHQKGKPAGRAKTLGKPNAKPKR